jgi:hypothetical protein
MREQEEEDAGFAATVARREGRRRQGALLVLSECCRRAGAAADDLRRTEQDGLDLGFGGPPRGRVRGAKRELARALRELEEAAFDPLVLSAAELAEAEELGPEGSPFP